MIYLCDSCFIISLADKTDKMHNASCNYLKTHIIGHYYLIPYPSMFETLSQRIVDDNQAMVQLDRTFLKKSEVNVAYISDKNYRDVSLYECMNDPQNIERHLSLVDTIIRNMIKSKNIRKDALISFNDDDFRDVCTQNKIDLITISEN